MNTYRRLGAVLLAGFVMLAAGCRKDIKLSDPNKAMEGLRTALDAWKAGEPREALAKRNPAIHLLDDDFVNGVRLSSYEIKGEGERFGANHCCRVKLSLVRSDGSTRERDLYYTIATNPVIAISREDRKKAPRDEE